MQELERCDATRDPSRMDNFDKNRINLYLLIINIWLCMYQSTTYQYDPILWDSYKRGRWTEISEIRRTVLWLKLCSLRHPLSHNPTFFSFFHRQVLCQARAPATQLQMSSVHKLIKLIPSLRDIAHAALFPSQSPELFVKIYMYIYIYIK